MHPESTVAPPVADAPAARNCVHCGAKSTTRFCGECGRPLDVAAAPGAPSGLLRESVAEMLGVEQGLLGTLRDLMLRPTKVFRAYLSGNREGYSRPFKVFFLLAGVYMLLLSLVHPFSFDTDPRLKQAIGELVAKSGVSEEVITQRVRGRMNTLTPLVIALALLPMAALLKTMRRERPFADHVMFQLTFSNCIWVLSILSVPLLLVAPQWAVLVLQLGGYAYIGRGFFAFYAARTRALTALKFAGYVAVDLTLTYLVGALLFGGVLLSALFF